jgi:hypothetical protein
MFLVSTYLEIWKQCHLSCTGNLPLLTQSCLLNHVTHQNNNTQIKYLKIRKDKAISVDENIVHNNSCPHNSKSNKIISKAMEEKMKPKNMINLHTS